MKIVIPNPGGAAEEYEAFQGSEHEVVFGEFNRAPGTQPSDGEVIEMCQGADCLISLRVSRQVIEALPQLTTIVGPAVGVEKIDIEAATENDVLVVHSPSFENVTGVSEAAIGLMLALSKRFKRKESRIREGEWGQRLDRGFLMWGKTVGIIGLGRTGSGVAKRLAGWDMTLLGYDPYVPDERFAELEVQRVDLADLFSQSDFVTVHVVITPETTKMVGEEQLRLMKPSAYLINTSRGESVDEAAVVTALEGNWIAGAALDVFDPEPPDTGGPLFGVDPEKLLLFPHNVAASNASRLGNLQLAARNAVAVMGGNIPSEYVKNPAVLPRWRGAKSPGKE
ncbi:MAG: NAD(P)-dependent oxidoreductase [Dehalococcoidia bacterium]